MNGTEDIRVKMSRTAVIRTARRRVGMERTREGYFLVRTYRFCEGRMVGNECCVCGTRAGAVMMARFYHIRIGLELQGVEAAQAAEMAQLRSGYGGRWTDLIGVTDGSGGWDG